MLILIKRLGRREFGQIVGGGEAFQSITGP